MKKLLSTLLISFIISLILSWYFYLNLNRTVPTRNQLSKIMDFLNTDTTTYDVVFIGSSRIYVHVDPRIIDSICGVNSINLGLDGSSITEQLPILRKYMQKHRAPKLIVLGLDYASLNSSALPYDYPVLYNYLNDTCFGPTVKLGIPHFRHDILFTQYDRFIEYSAKTDYQKFAAIVSGLKISRNFDHLSDEPDWFTGSHYKGFMGISRKWSKDADLEMENRKSVIFEQQGIAFLGDFLALAKKNAPDVVTIFAPLYIDNKKKYEDQEKYSYELITICSKYQVPFWDYRNDSLSYNRKYFYNVNHMTKAGAQIFSETLAGDINKYLKH